MGKYDFFKKEVEQNPESLYLSVLVNQEGFDKYFDFNDDLKDEYDKITQGFYTDEQIIEKIRSGDDPSFIYRTLADKENVSGVVVNEIFRNTIRIPHFCSNLFKRTEINPEYVKYLFINPGMGISKDNIEVWNIKNIDNVAKDIISNFSQDKMFSLDDFPLFKNTREGMPHHATINYMESTMLRALRYCTLEKDVKKLIYEHDFVSKINCEEHKQALRYICENKNFSSDFRLDVFCNLNAGDMMSVSCFTQEMFDTVYNAIIEENTVNSRFRSYFDNMSKLYLNAENFFTDAMLLDFIYRSKDVLSDVADTNFSSFFSKIARNTNSSEVLALLHKYNKNKKVYEAIWRNKNTPTDLSLEQVKNIEKAVLRKKNNCQNTYSDTYASRTLQFEQLGLLNIEQYKLFSDTLWGSGEHQSLLNNSLLPIDVINYWFDNGRFESNYNLLLSLNAQKFLLVNNFGKEHACDILQKVPSLFRLGTSLLFSTTTNLSKEYGDVLELLDTIGEKDKEFIEFLSKNLKTDKLSSHQVRFHKLLMEKLKDIRNYIKTPEFKLLQCNKEIYTLTSNLNKGNIYKCIDDVVEKVKPLLKEKENLSQIIEKRTNDIVER